MASPNLLSLTSLTEALLANYQPTVTSAVAAYTVPSGKSIKVTQAILCNATSSAVIVSIHVVPSGGSATAANKVINGYSIAGQDTVNMTDLLGGMMLGDGDFIAIQTGTANSVNLMLSGAVAA